ncbi:solute carrier family 13 member 5-like [Gigantopelta aegis]|uniref:solute carrier family 13 member 5-like n=1 Tax=Gigantopelta aegis TaxID=1735272 RepID=UPI001B88A0CC|nr:solute carrier family 13 member 5-like [Gigantopelta aegis]
MSVKYTLRRILDCKTLWMAILVPLLVLPLPLMYPNSVARCGYCVIVIGTFWVTEIIPLAVTSLLPIVLFPLFGIEDATTVCASYSKDTLMLFMGSLILAVAVERWNLHRRLALRTLTLVGPEPLWLMLGIMLPCWFLSMWMSNTATAAMMMPIVGAILEQIKTAKRAEAPEEEIKLEIIVNPPDEKNSSGEATKEAEKIDIHKEDAEFQTLAKSFSLCTAFAANIGGMATLTGTPPNIILKGQADILYKKYGAPGANINFANWLIMGVPLSGVCFIVCWLWLYIYTVRSKCLQCCKKNKKSYEGVRSALEREYKNMGSMSFAEVIVLINFIILAFLWITRKPGFIPGWSSLFAPGFTSDSTCAILISVLMFILPARPISWRGSSRKDLIAGAFNHYEPILNWKIVNDKLSWGVLLLMGGGFALADACQTSGLSAWVSGYLSSLESMPDWAIAMVLSLAIAGATEVTSNSATATLFLPITGELAVQLGVNPLYFMIPCAISASLAFLLPVATPPNAIAFATGYLEVKDMVLSGLPINIFAIIALNVALNSYGVPIYNLNQLPAIFNKNLTTTTPALPLNVVLLNATNMP